MQKVRKRDMGTVGRLEASLSNIYKGIEIPAKCSIERAKSFFEDKDFIPPKMVTVEPINACNLTCLMCPTYLTVKKTIRLDFEIFKQIVDESKEFQVFFAFQGTGEPFLNPQLFDMVAYAKKGGIKNISISTNGTLLTDTNIEKILNIDTSPDFLQISIDGHSKELFEKYRRGASFEKVQNGLKKLKERRKVLGFENKIDISINTLISNEFDIDEFIKTWGEYVDDITTGPMLNQAGQKCQEDAYLSTVQEADKSEYISCPKPFEIITVLADGKISHCQHDFHNIHIKGDMKKGDTLLNTWRNAEYTNFRQKHINFKAEETSCKGCEHMYRIQNQDKIFETRLKIKDFFSKRESGK